MLETFRLAVMVAKRNFFVYSKTLFSNVSVTIVEPIIVIIGFHYGLGSYIPSMQGLSYVEFLAPSLIITATMMTGFFEGTYTYYVRTEYEGISYAMLTTPISPKELILGEFLWIAFKGLLLSGLTGLAFAMLGYIQFYQIFLIAPIGILNSLIFGSIGLLCTSAIKSMEQFQTCYAFFIVPMYFFSGTFYEIQSLPFGIKQIVEFLPLSHSISLARSIAHHGQFQFESAAYIFLVMIFLTIWAAKRSIDKLYQ